MICSVDGCARPRTHREWCGAHYMRWKRTGDPSLNVRQARHQVKIDWLRAAAASDHDACMDWPWHVNGYTGYGEVRYEGKNLRAHRVACEMRNGACPPAMEAAHSCGRRSCVNGSHLRWDTKAGNMADKDAHGTAIRGERSVNAKLSTEDVLEIRAIGGAVSQRQLARMYGVGRTTIASIIDRKSWTHV